MANQGSGELSITLGTPLALAQEFDFVDSKLGKRCYSTLVPQLPRGDSPIRQELFHQGSLMLTTAYKRNIRVWDVSNGRVIAEIYVPEGSNYIGSTIRESELPDQDINVLTLYRGAKVIPNPRLDRVLEADDKLLCFGKLEAMREMIPPRTRRRRRPKLKDLPESAADE